MTLEEESKAVTAEGQGEGARREVAAALWTSQTIEEGPNTPLPCALYLSKET